MIKITVLDNANDKYALDVNGVKLSATKRGDSDSYIVYFNNKVDGVTMGNKTLSKKSLDDALKNKTIITFDDKPRASSGVRSSVSKTKVTKVVTDSSVDLKYGDHVLVSITDADVLAAMKLVDATLLKAETDADALAVKIAGLEKLGIPVDDAMLDALKLTLNKK